MAGKRSQQDDDENDYWKHFGTGHTYRSAESLAEREREQAAQMGPADAVDVAAARAEMVQELAARAADDAHDEWEWSKPGGLKDQVAQEWRDFLAKKAEYAASEQRWKEWLKKRRAEERAKVERKAKRTADRRRQRAAQRAKKGPGPGRWPKKA